LSTQTWLDPLWIYFNHASAIEIKIGTPPVRRWYTGDVNPSILRFTAVLLGLSFCLASGWAKAQKIQILWDQELAFENDRENYQRLLKDIVTRGATQVSSELGIRLMRPLKIKVHTRAGYEKEFGTAAAFSSGAHYRRGIIHVNGGNRLNQRFAGLLEHEMSHAFVDYRGTARALPTWLNEGMAERFRWRRLGMRGLAPNQVNELKEAKRKEKLVPLPVGRRLTPYGYLQGYAAVLFIESKYGKKKLGMLVHKTVDDRSFGRALKQVLNQEISYLEREFGQWVEDLE
jgi:hypothetical protein